jgi:hypothetical protein
MNREQEDAIQYHGNTFSCITVTVMPNVQELTVTISSKVFQKINQNVDVEPALLRRDFGAKSVFLAVRATGVLSPMLSRVSTLVFPVIFLKNPGPYLRLQTTTDKRKNFPKLYSLMGQAFSQMFISLPD